MINNTMRYHDLLMAASDVLSGHPNHQLAWLLYAYYQEANRYKCWITFIANCAHDNFCGECASQTTMQEVNMCGCCDFKLCDKCYNTAREANIWFARGQKWCSHCFHSFHPDDDSPEKTLQEQIDNAIALSQPQTWTSLIQRVIDKVCFVFYDLRKGPLVGH